MDYLKILNKNYDVLIDDTYDNLIRRPEKRPVRLGERTSYLTPVNDRDVIPTQFVNEPYPYLTSTRQTYFNIDFKVAKIFHRVYSLSRYTPYPLVGVKIPKGYRWRASWCVLPPEQQSAVLTVYIKKVNGDRITEEEMTKLLKSRQIEFIEFALVEDYDTEIYWDGIVNKPMPRLTLKKLRNLEEYDREIQQCGIQIFGYKRLLENTFYPNEKPYKEFSTKELDLIFDSSFKYLNIIDSVYKNYRTDMNTYRKEDVGIFEVAPKSYGKYTPIVIPTSTVSANVWGLTFGSKELNGNPQAQSGFVEQYFETVGDNSIQVVVEQNVYENLHPAENNANTKWSGTATLSYLVCV